MKAAVLKSFGSPLAIGVAVFITEMAPPWLRGPLAFTTELLAAIPSVIYGLWAMFILVPLLREHVNPFLIKGLGWTGFFADDNPTGLGGVAQADLAFVNATPINTNAYMSFMEILNVRSCDTGWARRASERCR